MSQLLIREQSEKHTFGKKDRLLWRARFLEVQDKGSKVHAAHFIVFALPNQLGWTRLGISVSRRVGPAVVRNGVKRRVREVFRLNRTWFPQSADVVIIARRSAAGVTFVQVMDDLRRATARLSRW